jgi:hypothetical protein
MLLVVLRYYIYLSLAVNAFNYTMKDICICSKNCIQTVYLYKMLFCENFKIIPPK